MFRLPAVQETRAMAEARKIALIGSLPIPVGHDVEVTWYASREESMSFLGREKVSKKDLPTPVVRDLNTGIVYGHLAHYREDGGIYPGRINVDEPTLRFNLQPRERFAGVVRQCQVIVISFDSAGRDFQHVETHLVVEG